MMTPLLLLLGQQPVPEPWPVRPGTRFEKVTSVTETGDLRTKSGTTLRLAYLEFSKRPKVQRNAVAVLRSMFRQSRDPYGFVVIRKVGKVLLVQSSVALSIKGSGVPEIELLLRGLAAAPTGNKLCMYQAYAWFRRSGIFADEAVRQRCRLPADTRDDRETVPKYLKLVKLP
jgi:hypothetical protein